MRAASAIDGAVLLGGASSRMGSDKAHVPVGGVACATRVARALEEVCGAVWLVGGAPPEGTPGRPARDPPGPRCALRGLVAALEASAAEHVLVVATDQPLVTPRFLRALAAAEPAEATVPRDASGPHPLCARYRRAAVLGPARARLSGSDLSLQGLLAALDTRWLEGDALRRADPDGTALLNVNTPADLERAEALLAAR